MLHYTTQEAVKKGITTIHGMEGGDMFSDKDIPVFLQEQDKFPLDILLFWDTEDVDNILKTILREQVLTCSWMGPSDPGPLPLTIIMRMETATESFILQRNSW